MVNDFYKNVGIVEQACGDCIVRIEAWAPDDASFDGYIDLQVISTNSGVWNMLFGTRIKNAWRVLRGRYDWSGFEITTESEAEALLAEIEVASKKAFPNFMFGASLKKKLEE